MMIQTSNELIDLSTHIRQALPDPKAILNLKILDRLGVVTFCWHGVEFLVRPSFQVLELRGNNVYVTGLSTLLQLVLARKNQYEKILESMLTRINEVEDLLISNEQAESAVRVLGSVKETMARLLSK